MRTIEWNYKNNSIEMIDQRILPGQFEIVEYTDYKEIVYAIQDMVIRGAPAIGAAAAFGMALAAYQSKASDIDSLRTDLRLAAQKLGDARPTAVNLPWALMRILRIVEQYQGNQADLRERILMEAQKIADEDVEINKRMAKYGASLIDDGDTVIHHCNTGALATVDWGTALGVIRMAYEQGKKIHVLVDETRPRLQGSRLTAWELQRYQIPFDVITDNAAGYFLKSGQVQKVVFGADRVASNGDVANKIGTYMLALAAHENQVPAYSVVPTSTIDLSLKHGGQIPIEERDPGEVLNLEKKGRPMSPEGITARNPAFDVTPNQLITAIVTENGIVRPPYLENLARAVEGLL
ncbi:MAG: S-methyl-5-thioribose-1-phosphate isomerase [Anaerolineales bacterium]|jgi:methylthioribose-1-phosphate isomerase